MMTRHTQVSAAVLDPSSGYVLLTIPMLDSLTFPERMAFEDDDLRRELAQHEPSVLQAGFCDWVDATAQTRVCIGWTWCLKFGDPCEHLAPGGFSCNLMLLDADGSALGRKQTDRLLHDWLSTKAWQDTLVESAGHYLRHDRWH